MFIIRKLIWTEEYNHYSKFSPTCMRHAPLRLPTYSKRATIISLFLYETRIFYTKFYQNLHQNASPLTNFRIPHSNRAGKVIIFYFKIVTVGNVLRQNLIKMYTKTHQIAPFFIIFFEEVAPEPLCHAQHAVLRHAYIHF